MEVSLKDDLTGRLVADYGFKQTPKWLNMGRCPQCAKRELFTSATAPWTIRCGRESACGFEQSTRELYPDAFKPITERFPSTEADPHATARNYLIERGLNISKISGSFAQERYYHGGLKIGAATVRFYLDPQKHVYWERLLENEKALDRKANFGGDHGKLVWQPPGMDLSKYDHCFLVEGIFDCISLWQNGHPAVALLSCNKYPQALFNAHPSIRWVWALDGDKAGKKYTLQHVRRARAANLEVDCALIPEIGGEKSDWNDVAQEGAINNEILDKYYYHGRLHIAKTAMDRALLMYKETQRSSFPMEFGNRYYWFNLDLEKYHKAHSKIEDEDGGLTEDEVRDQALAETSALITVANCHPQFLYYQANEITDESWYYLRVSFPHNGACVKNTFTGAQLSGASEFKKRLLAIAPGAMFTGNSGQLDSILERHTFNIKRVATVDYIGYSKEYKTWIFNDVAVHAGDIRRLNDEDYFELPKKSVKTLSRSPLLDISRKECQIDWFSDLYTAFGPRGTVVLAWWLGSLFAEQIREGHKSFPFLEVIGDPGAGKTTLVEFLWRLVGREDYEGFDPSNSTAAGRARNFVQVSNLPVVLLEGDRGDEESKGRRFDFNELKLLYNGRGVRSRGQKNNANDTYEPPFRGAVLITQNAEVVAEDAVLQRIVHTRFTTANQTPQSAAAAQRLEKIATDQVSNFVLQVTCRERELLEIFNNRCLKYQARILEQDDVHNVRVAKNHGQTMAMVDMLKTVIGLSDKQHSETINEVLSMAKERQRAIGADHPLVQEFWEIYDYIEDRDDHGINHSKKPERIAIRLPEFVERAAKHNQKIPDMSALKRVLRTSRKRKFIDFKSINSAILSTAASQRSAKCWVFENK